MSSKFRYEQVFNDLQERIIKKDWESGSLLPSEKELCALYDTSLITVRRALKELEDIGAVTKVKGKGTVINSVRRANPSGRTIAVLSIPIREQAEFKYPRKYTHVNEWGTNIMEAMFLALSSDFNVVIDGYEIEDIIQNYDKLPIAHIDKIVVLVGFNKDLIDFLQAKGKYLVVYNNFNEDIKVAGVSNNERQGCRQAVQYLIDQGHRDIAVINGVYRFDQSVERYIGFQEALIYNQIPLRTQWVRWGDMTTESGYYLMKEILAETDRPPTAVFCVNDLVGIGAMDAIREAGLRCPEDVSVLAHDNNRFCEELTPRLTSIDPNYDKVGKEIAERFRRELWVEDTTIIPCDLVVRDSVASYSPQLVSKKE